MNASPLLDSRAISFHHCDRVNRPLIDLAHALGFNEVQLQMENGNMTRLRELAKIQREEKLLDFIHSRQMKVSVWLHEFEELPDDVGPITRDNERLWDAMRERYRFVVQDLLPEVDRWVLTVVESRTRVTDPEILARLAVIINEACQSKCKQLVLRTFVWHPDEFEGVMAATKTLPPAVMMMTKVVPQDWHMRGPHDRAIGAVKPHEQILEFDIAGEYFYGNRVANCFPGTIAGQVAYGRSKGVMGVCVRVDRGSDDIFHMPQEMNLWALAAAAGCRIPGAPHPLPAGDEEMVEVVWRAWATHEFGARAADAAVAVLKTSGEVIAEALCVGPFSFGDTRRAPPFQEAAFTQNWQPQRWEPAYLPLFEKAEQGDPDVISTEEKNSGVGTSLAIRALRHLQENEVLFETEDYQFLHAKLTANLDFIQIMSAMQQAYLRMRRMGSITDEEEKKSLRVRLQEDLEQLQQIHAMDRTPVAVNRRGIKATVVQRPLDPGKWIKQLEEFLKGNDEICG